MELSDKKRKREENQTQHKESERMDGKVERKEGYIYRIEEGTTVQWYAGGECGPWNIYETSGQFFNKANLLSLILCVSLQLCVIYVWRWCDDDDNCRRLRVIIHHFSLLSQSTFVRSEREWYDIFAFRIFDYPNYGGCCCW